MLGVSLLGAGTVLRLERGCVLYGKMTKAGNERVRPPPPISYTRYLVHVGEVGVGWRRRCKTHLSLRELLTDNQGTLLFFWRSSRLAVELDHVGAGRTLTLHKGEGKGPTRQLHSELVAVSGRSHTRK